MFLRWFWRAVLTLVVGAFFGLVFLAYWAGWRTMPALSGNVTLAVSAAAEVRRDMRGVPHITAKSIEDAMFLQGYVTAQDRIWQMEALRRRAAGELSEVVGAAAYSSDVESRQLRLRRVAEFHAHRMPSADRASLAAFARGVNAFLRSHAGKLSPELTLLDYDPRPWTIADTVLVGLEMHRQLTTSWKSESGKLAMLSGGDRQKVETLFPPRTGLEIQPGSNAWVVSGKHTASGKPLLANDPHLMWSLPGVWYMIHIEAPGLNVAGVSLPGVPGVIIGHNEHIAWGVTNLGYDVQDLYEERIDFATGRYVVDGRLQLAAVEREIVPVRGSKPYEVPVVVTRHGPVIYSDGQRHFALRWTASEEGYEFPFLDLNRARDWTEFRAALARFTGPGQNFVYADREGNIGYQATGKLPLRKQRGDVPTPGWDAASEWQGYVPFGELPSHFNPPDGMIVTANQNPFPADYKYAVHGDFAAHYRANQIAALLRAREGWKPDDFIAIQKDVYSQFSHFLSQEVVKAFDRKKPTNRELPPAVNVLRGWNGQMDKDSAAPMVVSLVYQKLRFKIASSAAPGRAASYLDQMAPAVIEQLLRERPKAWFADWDKLLIECLDDAIEDREGRRAQGSDFARWQYGRYNDLTVPNQVLSNIPVLGELLAGRFNVGPVPMSGSSSTVKQTARTIGPSMRFVADLSDWNNSRMNVTIGQSGHVFSANYKDQWETYWAGRGMPFRFDGPAAGGAKVLKVEPLR